MMDIPLLHERLRARIRDLSGKRNDKSKASKNRNWEKANKDLKSVSKAAQPAKTRTKPAKLGRIVLKSEAKPAHTAATIDEMSKPTDSSPIVKKSKHTDTDASNNSKKLKATIVVPGSETLKTEDTAQPAPTTAVRDSQKLISPEFENEDDVIFPTLLQPVRKAKETKSFILKGRNQRKVKHYTYIILEFGSHTNMHIFEF